MSCLLYRHMCYTRAALLKTYVHSSICALCVSICEGICEARLHLRGGQAVCSLKELERLWLLAWDELNVEGSDHFEPILL